MPTNKVVLSTEKSKFKNLIYRNKILSEAST